MENLSIEDLRKNIDAIDRQILDLLKERSSYVYQVGHVKKKSAPKESIMRPGREALIIRKVTGWNSGKMLKEAVASIWRTIIAGSIAIEQKTKIMVFSGGDERIFAAAQDYYGNFSNIKSAKSVKEIITAIGKSKTTVGIITANSPFFFESWFLKFMKENPSIHIFAKLPYMKSKKISSPPAFVIGHVVPEETGDDCSLLMLETSGKINYEKISAVLLKQKIKTELISENTKNNNSYFLVEANYGDNKIKNFPGKIYSLGSYARPVKL